MRWLGISVGLILVLMWTSPVAAVVINEFLPNPEGNDTNSEWVEFYNPDSSTVDLSDYFFDDDNDFQSDSKSKPKQSLIGMLGPLTTCYWEISNYLNNGGDWPTLFTADGAVVDDYEYKDTSEEKSYARVPDGGDWQAEQVPTKSLVNCLDLAPTPTLSPTPTATPTPTQPTPKATVGAAPTPTPPTSPTPKATAGTTPKPTASAQVLAATVAAEIAETPTATPSATPQPETNKQGKWPWLMMIGGGGLAVAALFPFLRKWYHDPSWLKTLLKGGDRSSFGQE